MAIVVVVMVGGKSGRTRVRKKDGKDVVYKRKRGRVGGTSHQLQVLESEMYPALCVRVSDSSGCFYYLLMFFLIQACVFCL